VLRRDTERERRWWRREKMRVREWRMEKEGEVRV
jgi:hypothetical protein